MATGTFMMIIKQVLRTGTQPLYQVGRAILIWWNCRYIKKLSISTVTYRTCIYSKYFRGEQSNNFLINFNT